VRQVNLVQKEREKKNAIAAKGNEYPPLSLGKESGGKNRFSRGRALGGEPGGKSERDRESQGRGKGSTGI